MLKTTATAAGFLTLAGCASSDGAGNDGGDGSNGSGGSDGSGGTGGGSGPAKLTLATSVEGSTSFRIGSSFGQYLKREGIEVPFTWNAVVSPGATGGYRMMDKGEVNLSGPSTYGLNASPDQGPFAEQPLERFDDVRQIRGFFSVQPFVVVRADSGIEAWDDLAGKTISVGSAGAGTRVPSERMVELELGEGGARIEYVSYGEQPAALRGGRVDAIFGYVNNAGTSSTVVPGWMQELDSTVEWRHVPFTEGTLSSFDEELSYASTLTVDGKDLFSKFTGEITVYNLSYAWVGHADLDASVVKELARVSHEHGEKLIEADSAMGFFPDADWFLGTLHPEVPVHEGAYEYYQEAGLWDQYELTPPPEAGE
ncbi:TAXI family TRAP transporter solute-binding subunit [Halomarina halobia]